MATEAQIAANRLNAQSSTGPRTEAGKSASSRNAITLGIYTKRDYVKSDEEDFYRCFCVTMHKELDPQTLVESTLAEEIASATWRLRRCNAAEAELGDYSEDTDKLRRSIERARSAAHSVLHRSINQFRKLQADHAKSASICKPGNYGYAAEGDLGSNCTQGHAAEAALASNCKPAPQTARNAPCPCNSGEKYKRCCGKNAPPVLGKAA